MIKPFFKYASIPIYGEMVAYPEKFHQEIAVSFALEKNFIGGTKAPFALIHITAVDKSPDSTDVRGPSCFLLLTAIIFKGRDYMVVILVLFTLNVLNGGKCFYWSGFKTSKKKLTVSFLKPLILAPNIASGIQ